MVPTYYTADPIAITEQEFDRFAREGNPTSEANGMRLVKVPDAVYQERARQVAQNRTREKARRRARAQQRRRRA